MWRQAVNVERGVSERKAIVGIMWDLEKCYEHVDHARLKGEATVLEYPLRHNER